MDLTKLPQETKQLLLNWAAARAEVGKMNLQEWINGAQAVVQLSQQPAPEPAPEPEQKDEPSDKGT